MTATALLRLAWRESRTARRRLALYMSSIAFGVAALVAIDSFAGNVTGSIRDQSRTLLGGDIALQARAEFPAVVDTLLDSLNSAGVPNAKITTFASMALAEPSGGTRLVQVRAVSRGYPFYGAIETVPAGGWATVHDQQVVFVDPSLLIALDATVGDSLRLGTQFFRIAGTLGNVPGDAGITAVIGPRIYISDRWIPSTGLLSFGSRAEYDAVLKLPSTVSSKSQAALFARGLRRRIDPRAAALQEADDARRGRGDDTEEVARNNTPAGAANATDGARTTAVPMAAARTPGDSAATATVGDSTTNGLASPAPRTRVRVRTVADTERDFTEAVVRLADFLSIIGLIALLLGGIGVASGVNAFVSAKIDTVAVLRCLGATSRQVLALYVVQSAAMGFVGALAGALLGVGIQFLLPQVVSDFLPVDVTIALEWQPLALGLITGVWVALVFSLRPLLALRRVSPLQAIRRDADTTALPREWKDPARLLVDGLLIGSLVAIIVARLGEWREGLAISGAITVAVAVLWVAATLLIALARRSTRPSWPFTVRQGIANLHRPANQTRAVTLALGFGAFLLSTVYLVQANLLGRVQSSADASAGNLLFFDVQDDQAQPLDSLLRARKYEVVQRTPIVTMRIDAVNGKSVAAIMADTTVRRAGWALRREYRSTYRETVVGSEVMVGGRWWADSATRAAERLKNPDAPFPVSFERDVATDLGVGLGDTVTWNVQGVPVRTVITSLRTVNFARFEANFFVVFAPEAIRRAPQQYVVVANVPGGAPLAAIQRDVVRRFPNISSLDLTLVRETVGAIVNRVVLAIRFLGLFSLAMGIPVLFSAVAATRRARLREGVLLRTLGASRAQVARVLLAEYGALGALGATTGMLLAFAGAWGLTRFVFKDPFDPAVGPTLVIAIGMLVLTMTIGFLTSRDVYKATPMQAIRES
ncbi:MAG: FtsX-like permease family protein [Gemmatimonadaceae bacterium]|nr:FtsX-like permease family protein [Gemmatimonadaceae bacterium]